MAHTGWSFYENEYDKVLPSIIAAFTDMCSTLEMPEPDLSDLDKGAAEKCRTMISKSTNTQGRAHQEVWVNITRQRHPEWLETYYYIEFAYWHMEVSHADVCCYLMGLVIAEQLCKDINPGYVYKARKHKGTAPLPGGKASYHIPHYLQRWKDHLGKESRVLAKRISNGESCHEEIMRYIACADLISELMRIEESHPLIQLAHGIKGEPLPDGAQIADIVSGGRVCFDIDENSLYGGLDTETTLNVKSKLADVIAVSQEDIGWALSRKDKESIFEPSSFDDIRRWLDENGIGAKIDAALAGVPVEDINA